MLADRHLSAAEIEGEPAEGAAPAGAHVEDVEGELQDIDFDDGMACLLWCTVGCSSRCIEDQTNIHRHARRNAQEAIALAKSKAQAFDAQAALERKTTEALKLAKAQAHLRPESTETSSGTSAGTPLVDREHQLFLPLSHSLT